MLDPSLTLNRFLAAEERRALKHAEIATGFREDALDIVQDAMYKLAERYAHRSPSEWGPLFQRILMSRINDWHRRQGVRRRFRVWLRHREEAPEEDPLDNLPGEATPLPEELAAQQAAMDALETSLRRLPNRQRQAFLLRVWQGYDVRETARIMGVGEGSVKTHLARATKVLKADLAEHV